MTEKSIITTNGFAALIIALLSITLGVFLIITGSISEKISGGLVVLLGLIIATSLTIVQPDISLEKHKNTCHFMVLIETQFLAKVQARK
jgi:hypothetical protein